MWEANHAAMCLNQTLLHIGSVDAAGLCRIVQEGSINDLTIPCKA